MYLYKLCHCPAGFLSFSAASRQPSVNRRSDNQAKRNGQEHLERQQYKSEYHLHKDGYLHHEAVIGVAHISELHS